MKITIEVTRIFNDLWQATAKADFDRGYLVLAARPEAPTAKEAGEKALAQMVHEIQSTEKALGQL